MTDRMPPTSSILAGRFLQFLPRHHGAHPLVGEQLHEQGAVLGARQQVGAAHALAAGAHGMGQVELQVARPAGT
jgi:hypothetical protein